MSLTQFAARETSNLEEGRINGWNFPDIQKFYLVHYNRNNTIEYQ